MTFNQWCSSARVNSSPAKIALEAIWNELIGAGISPGRVGALLDELMFNMRERRP